MLDPAVRQLIAQPSLAAPRPQAAPSEAAHHRARHPAAACDLPQACHKPQALHLPSMGIKAYCMRAAVCMLPRTCPRSLQTLIHWVRMTA